MNVIFVLGAARTRRNISAWLSDSDKRVAVIKRTSAPLLLLRPRSSLLFHQRSFHRSANIALVINFPRDSTRVPGSAAISDYIAFPLLDLRPTRRLLLRTLVLCNVASGSFYED